MYSELNLY